MLDRLKTLFASRPLRTRALEAASPRRPWGAPIDQGNPVNSAGVVAVRRKSQHAYINNSWFHNGVDAHVSALVGAGITAASSVGDPAARAAIGAAFSQYGDRADADGLGDIFAFQSRAALALVVDGEAIVHFTPTGLRLLAADQLDMSLTRELRDGRIINGVEFDISGRRCAFHILPFTGMLNLSIAPPVRIPAEDVAHVFRAVFPGQVRGIPWGSSVLLGLNEADQLQDAMLVAAKVSAMMMGFVIDQNSTGVIPFDGKQDGSILTGGLEPGTLKILPSGFDVKFTSPQQVTTAIDLAKLTLRSVAAGLGVPEAILTGDYSQANYSSLRAALVEFRRRTEQTQFHVIIPQLLNPIWRRWLTMEILAGRIPAPGFESDPESWLAVEWYPPPMPWVDPLKDAEAEVALIAAGLKSRRQSVAERGYSIEQLDAEIAADRQRETKLGLNFSTAPAPQTGATTNAP